MANILTKMYIMKKERAKTGLIETRPIEIEDVPTITSKDKMLAYYPESKYPVKMFWIKLVTTKVILLDYQNPMLEVDIVPIEKLRKIIFVDKESGKELPLKRSQWQFLLDENKVDTNSQVSGVLEQGVVRFIPKTTFSTNDLLTRLTSGFSSPDAVREIIENYGFRLQQCA